MKKIRIRLVLFIKKAISKIAFSIVTKLTVEILIEILKYLLGIN